MRKLFVACFVLLVAGCAFSASQAWQCSGFVATGSRVAVSGDYAAIGTEEIEIYHRDSDGWKFHQRIECPEELKPQVQLFGLSLSMRNDLCVVGAMVHVSSVGYVFIYRLTDGKWLLEQMVPSPYLGDGTLFGDTVDVDGDVCAVTSSFSGGDEYRVELHLYRFDGEQWRLEQTIAEAGNGLVRGDRCALIKRVSGDNGLISIPFIYRFEDNEWIEEKEFDFPFEFYSEQFDFSGDKLAVTTYVNNSGQMSQKVVRIYGFDGVDWIQEAELTSPYGAEEYFGGEVVISDNVCVVGSGSFSWEEGQDFVYELIDDMWVLTGRFDKSFEYPVSNIKNFGFGIACDKDTILATAYDYSGYSWVYSFEKCPAMDFDGDCFVGVGDLQVFADEWLSGRR